MYDEYLFRLLRSALDLYYGFLFCDDIETAKAYLRLINNLNGQILDDKEDK